MIKKFIMIFTAACLLVQTAVFAEVSVSYDMATSSIIVSGELPEGVSNREVSVNILYPDKTPLDMTDEESPMLASAFSAQRPAELDNTFEFTAEIDGKTGYYTVWYKYEGLKSAQAVSVYYVNKEDNKKALEGLNAAESADKVYEILKSSSADLCFDNEFDEAVNLKRVSQRLFEEISETPLDTEDYLSASVVYDRICLYEALYEGVAVNLEAYYDTLGISECSAAEWYDSYKSEAFNTEISKRLAGKEIDGKEDFAGYFDEAVVLSVVYMPNGSGNVKKVMEDYKDEIGISSLLSNEKIYKNLSGDVYMSYEALKDGYDDEADKLSASESKKTSGGGGGGGGSVTSMTTDTPIPGSGYQDLSSLYPNMNYNGKTSFADIDVVPWAHEAIADLCGRGILSGDENGNFNPEEFLKREQFAKILVTAFGLSDKGTVPVFADVSEGDWYCEYVNIAYSNGVISGKGDYFGVGEVITRQDMAVMITNALQASGKELTSNELSYNDNDKIADYAKDAVSKMISSKVMKDIGNGYFNPDGLVTRANAAKYIYLALGL